jgi:hypothetical protein
MKFNLFDYVYPVKYWIDFINYYRTGKKVKKELIKFFNSEESKELQNAFSENFDYPKTMTEPPVRFYKDEGLIYYVLNFKNKEVWDNQPSKEFAYLTSIKLLDEHLPLGTNDYLEPLENLEMDETFSIFCSFIINKDIKENMLSVISSILLNIGLTTSLIILIIFLLK